MVQDMTSTEEAVQMLARLLPVPSSAASATRA